MILFINNNTPIHNEIIESIIVKYKEIIGKDVDFSKIYLYAVNEHLKKYIKSQYPEIILSKPTKFDYYINATIYPLDLEKPSLLKNSSLINEIQLHSDTYYYISHTIDNIFNNVKNVLYLTPLAKRFIYADVLPFSDEKKMNQPYPIYCIQGNITEKRRNYTLLENILKNNYKFKYKIKIIGRGSLPPKLNKYKKKLIVKNNLNFIDYHKEFLDCYCILPLILKKSHPTYYHNKLTSSINYARGYKLKCIIDEDLQKIYHLPNATIYHNENDIVQAFNKTLKIFYKQSNLYLAPKSHYSRKGNKIIATQPTTITKTNRKFAIQKKFMKKSVKKGMVFTIINEKNNYYVI